MRIFAHFAKSGSRTGTPRRSPAAGDSFRVSDMPDSGQQTETFFVLLFSASGGSPFFVYSFVSFTR